MTEYYGTPYFGSIPPELTEALIKQTLAGEMANKAIAEAQFGLMGTNAKIEKTHELLAPMIAKLDAHLAWYSPGAGRTRTRYGFAEAAMNGLLAKPGPPVDDIDGLATAAVMYADALLAALEKEKA